MGWSSDWPITSAGTDIQNYGFLIQLWEAIRERYVAAGSSDACCDAFPQHNTSWDWGEITDITATSLTDSIKTWNVLPSDFCSGKRWAGLSCSNAPWDPSEYDVVIDADFSPDRTKILNCDGTTLGYFNGTGAGGACDPCKVVRAQISDNNATTLTISDISDYVTAGYIPSIESLVGKKYSIIKRDGLWYADHAASLGRWISCPNDFEHAKGTVTSAASTYIEDSTKNWHTDEWAGKEVLVYATDGRLKRATITANTKNRLEYATQTWTPTGAYIVVDVGGKGFPNKVITAIYNWYGGAKDYWTTHDPSSDTVGSVGLAAPIVKWQEPVGEGGLCEDVSHDCFDGDCWSAVDEECGAWHGSDKSYSPDLYKTLRGLQVAVEGASGYYVAPGGTDGDVATFVPATLFQAAGINASSSNITGVDLTTGTLSLGSGLGFDIPDALIPYFGAYYAVLDKRNKPIFSGIGTIANTAQTSFQCAVDDKMRCKTLVVSLGWTRYMPREFRYPHQRGSVFIPDEDTSEGGVGVVDPAGVVDFADSGCFGIGQWITRNAVSTTYKDLTTPYGHSGDGAETFITGELARYTGDTWADPGITPSSDEGSPLDPYWDRFNVSRHPPVAYHHMQGQKRGVSTSADANSLTATTKNWWNYWHSGNGVMRTEGGTATGGSSTSITDTSKTIGTESGCMWDGSRWVDGTAYVGFVVEINIPDVVDGVTTDHWYKRVITSSTADGSGVSVSWSGPLPSTASGKAYRIREPYQHDRYIGRTLVLKPHKISGDTDEALADSYTVTVTTNDDTTLWFTPSVPVLPENYAWRFHIEEMVIGGVYKWDGSQWVKPTGADTVRTAVTTPEDFKSNLRSNLPTIVKRYGRMSKGDYVDFGQIYNELYAAINVLTKTVKGVAWSSRQNDCVPEKNARSASRTNCCSPDDPDYATCYGNLIANLHCDYDQSDITDPPEDCTCGCSSPFSEEGGAPLALYENPPTVGDCMSTATIHRRYAYAHVGGVTNCIPCSITLYALAGLLGYERQPPNCGDCGCDDPTWKMDERGYCTRDCCEDCGDQIDAPCPPEEGNEDFYECCGCLSPVNHVVYTGNGDVNGDWGVWGTIATTTYIDTQGNTHRFRVGDPTLSRPASPGAPSSTFETYHCPLDPDPDDTILLAKMASCQIGGNIAGYEIYDAKAVVTWTFDYHA